MDVHSDFNAKQKAAIRWLAERISGGYLERQGVMSETGLGVSDYEHLMHGLVAAKAVELVISDTGIYANDIQPGEGLRGLVFHLDRPPKRDYWKEIGIWFRSKAWSVPVFVIVVGLPALYSYYLMVKALAEWMGWL